MPPPAHPEIYHIVHVDRLPSIISDGCLWSDATMAAQMGKGTTIGMGKLKRRRLEELTLTSHPRLHVGECVPFYFGPRSVMLYILHMGNHSELTYRGGQGPIIHLQADLQATVAWAESNKLRWAFTLSNAASRFFEDRADLRRLNDIDWGAVRADYWSNCREQKQAEFLIEQQFPWQLVSRIGVHSSQTKQQVLSAVTHAKHKPQVSVERDWYY